MAEIYTSRQLFHALDGKKYQNYAALEEDVLSAFRKNLVRFPVHYTGYKLLTLAERKGWIVPGPGKTFRIHFRQDEVAQ